MFIGLAAMWGSAFVGIKAGLEYFPPLLYAAFRYDLAALILTGYAGMTARRFWPHGRAEWVDVIVSAMFIIGGFQALLFLGQQYTTSAVAAMLVCMSPVLVTGFSRALLPDERLAAHGILGLVICFIGVGLIIRPDPTVVSESVRGEVLIVMAAAVFALGSVLTRTVAADVSLPLVSREAWAMVLGAGILHLTSFWSGESWGDVSWTLEGVTALVYLAVVPSVIGYLVFFDLLDRIGPIEVNLVSFLNPVFAALIGWMILRERLVPLAVVGFLIVCLGFVILKYDAFAARFRQLRGGGVLARLHSLLQSLSSLSAHCEAVSDD